MDNAPSIVKGKLLQRSADQSGGGLTFTGLGVVFSRADAFRDLYDDRFLPDVSLMRDADAEDDGVVIGTDYGVGDWLIPGRTSVPLTWDHGMGVLGRKVLGSATFSRLTDEGLEFLIQVTAEQAGRYAELVEWAYSRNILGLSSQTLSTMFDYDWQSGIVKSWRIGEMALTVTPADPRTRESLMAKARSLKIVLESGDDEMARKAAQRVAEELEVLDPEVQEPADEVVTETITEPVGAELEDATGFVAELEGVSADLAAELDASLSAETRTVLADTLARNIQAMNALTERMGQIESRGVSDEQIQAIVAAVTEQLEPEFRALRQGFVSAFRSMTEVFSSRVRGLAVEAIAAADGSPTALGAIVEAATEPVSPARVSPTTPQGVARDKNGVPLTMPGR